MKSAFPIIKTDRLLLRQFVEDDLENVFKGLSHPDIIKYYGVSYNLLESTKEQMKFFTDLEENETGIWWAICSADNKTFYGAGGLNSLNKNFKKAEIGFWLLSNYWGKVIMKEAMPLICNYGFNNWGLHRIEGFVESENKNCKRAMAKRDFIHEGTMKDCEIKNGKFISLDIYSKLNTKTKQMKNILPILFLLFSFASYAQIPTDSLKGFYNFNNSLSDFSGNANHIISGSGSFTTDRFGEAGNAFLLDGINDSLVFPIHEFAPVAGDFTISFWYKTNSSDIMNLFSSKQSPDDTTNNFEIQLNSHSAYYLEYLKQSWYQTFVYWNGSGNNPNALGEGAPGNFTKGEWCHFLITRNADTFKIFRNHDQYIFSIDNLNGGPLGDLTELVFSSSPHHFKGAIDDMRFYNRGMNQAEVDLLWFENSPFHFISPNATDAYVQSSSPLIYWTYDTTQVSDSINVDYRINNGSWLIWEPHSHMAYENAFYMSLSGYAPGTFIEVRVADRADTSLQLRTGSFTVSEYDWVEVTDSLPFTARDGSGLLNFKNKMWLLGGWDPPNHYPNYTHSEVWSSSDGSNWNFETTAPWPPRHCAAWLTNDTVMWVIGGDPQSGCLTDVWQSDDGINWIQLVDTIPGYAKRNNPNYAYANNSLFMFGGEVCSSIHSNEVWKSSNGSNWTQLPDAPWSGRGMQLNSCVDGSGQIWMLGGSNEGTRRSFNEVWKTSDGTNWALVNESAPWAGRYWHTVAWFNNKIWLMAGMATAIEMNDVWYSEDGINWHELKSTFSNWPLSSRHAQSTTVFDNALWFMCGIASNNAWKLINTTLPVNIPEITTQQTAVYVFPNPARDHLTIRTIDNLPIGKICVYNILGVAVIETSFENRMGEVDVSQLQQGCYTICFENSILKPVIIIKQ
ncbi:MAG: GNAT family N-acetyltransferase [Chitinophagales bacterium]|nr:GNAT family N-acetyltransferase [Chitinophagales bacterium]